MKTLLLLLTGLLSASGATFYVSISGNDSNPGTQVQPWRTIQKAANTVNPNDTVLVGPGRYEEAVTTPRGGEPSRYITFDGQGGASVRQFTISSAYIRIQGFTVAGAPKFAGLITLAPGGHHARILNNFLDSQSITQVNGIFFSVGSVKPFDVNAASFCVVESNVITRINSFTAITVAGQSNVIANNIITNLTDADFFRGFGRFNTIRDNFCKDNRDGEGGFHKDIFQTFGVNGDISHDFLVERNTIINAEQCQLTQFEAYNPDVRDWTFRNNIIMDIGLQASINIPGVKWFNNLFYRCNAVSHALNYNWYDGGPTGRGQAYRASVRNNIFLGCGDGRTLVGWYGFNTNLTDFDADYNFVADLGGRAKDAGPVRRAFTWKEDHGINGGGIPLAVNPDFSIDFRQTLLIQDKGVALLGFSSDINGNPRPLGVTWDIGPFEMQGLDLTRPNRPQGVRISP